MYSTGQRALFTKQTSREAGGSWRRGRPAGSASVTHSPESPLFERRAGLGGPTPAARQGDPDATRPSPRWLLMDIEVDRLPTPDLPPTSS